MFDIKGIQGEAGETAAARRGERAPAPGSLVDRLLRWGPKALSNGELLAVVLGDRKSVV